MKKFLTFGIYFISSLLGLIAFLYPFILPIAQNANGGLQPRGDAPLLTVGLLSLCLIALLLDMQGQAVSAKIVATLGVLIAITSVLRFLETAIPGPGGFSPIFAPIILAGFVFGSRFGFLLGSLTLAVSALITGSVGSWLPFQMFAAGWIGMGAGILPKVQGRAQIILLSAYGLLTGLFYGALMNLYFWPFVVGDPTTSYAVGSGVGEIVRRYALFYVATSLLWDLMRGVGNVIFIVLLGQATIRALQRFQRRFAFSVEIEVEEG